MSKQQTNVIRLKPVTATNHHYRSEENREMRVSAVAAWREKRQAEGNQPSERESGGVAPLPNTPTPKSGNANKADLSHVSDSEGSATCFELPPPQIDGERQQSPFPVPRHIICRTYEPLTVADGVVWEGGKRSLSVRAMLARALAKGEL